MSLQTLINRALDSPVDFTFIKRVVGKTISIRMVDHESSLKHRPSLADVFKGHDAVAILLHIIQGKSKIGHWTLLLKKKGKNLYQKIKVRPIKLKQKKKKNLQQKKRLLKIN